MDDSQSSDFLSNSMDYSYNSPNNMNTVPYDTLVINIKESLSKYIHNGIPKTSLSSDLSTLLEDCSTCISQSLDLITGLLVDSEVHYMVLTQYMENAVSLLQMLSNFIKTIMESLSLSYTTMKTFPITTGNIVLMVFNHCKDSETLYNTHLKHVEKHLKDLFRTCHELQLTYLMVMEKHFIFDLTEKEEQDILMKALDINLAIGDIVQTLDVKTMAEQWKAYTAICEKYSIFLSDKVIFEESTKILSTMTMNNITSALEAGEDKIVLRSLKIASFTVKIILKLCGIFKNAPGKNFANIMELFIFIYKHNGPYLELVHKKSSQFINQVTALVVNPSDFLLAQLVLDDAFSQCCLHFNTDTLSDNDDMLGYIMLLTTTMAKVLDKNQSAIAFKSEVFRCIFKILPKCHVWFNKGLKFTPKKYVTRQTYGLYEHVLIHAIALASGLTEEQYTVLEETMYEALLGVDCWGALFASDLWVALAKSYSSNNRELIIIQFVLLCKTYKSLEKNRLFMHSPQQVYLSYTIARLFEVMETGDKKCMYKSYGLAVWTPLQIKNTPPEVQEKVVEDTINELLTNFEKYLSLNIQSEQGIRHMIRVSDISALLQAPLSRSDWMCSEIFILAVIYPHTIAIYPLTGALNGRSVTATTTVHFLTTNSITFTKNNLMKAASTCRFVDGDETFEDYVVKVWLKICPKDRIVLNQGDLDKSHIWYFEHIEALVALTKAMRKLMKDDAALAKILHAIANIAQLGNIELNLIILDLLCQLALQTSNDDKNTLETLTMDAFKSIIQKSDNVIHNCLLTNLKKYTDHQNFEYVVAQVFSLDNSLQDLYGSFLHGTSVDWRKWSQSLEDTKFTHKCVDNAIELISSGSSRELKENSSNFEFADIESLFGDSDSEPASKKAKITNEGRHEEVIARLEADSLALCSEKENVFSNDEICRIRNVCDRLRNIID